MIITSVNRKQALNYIPVTTQHQLLHVIDQEYLNRICQYKNI